MIWVSGKGLGPKDRKVSLKDLSDGQFLNLCEELKKISAVWRLQANDNENEEHRRKTIWVGNPKGMLRSIIVIELEGKGDLESQLREEVLEITRPLNKDLVAIMTAIWTASNGLDRGLKKVTKAPAILARVSQAGSSRSDTRWDQMRLNAEVSNFLDELVECGKMPSVDASPVDAAKFWLNVCEAIWDPKQRARIAKKVFARKDVDITSHLAGVWLELNPEQKVTVAGATYSVENQNYSCVWRQVMEWEGGGIKKNILRYMTGYKREIKGVEEIYRSLATRDIPKINARRAAAISIKNMNEAELSPACKPTGSFRVKVPEQILLSRWGVSGLRVWIVHDKGMWVALEMDGRPRISFKWGINKPHLQRWILPERAIPTVHAVLSALWRDLCVGGRRVMIDKDTEFNGKKAEPTPGKVKFFGKIQWGSESDLKNIMKVAHNVSWHLRELPKKKASWRAKKVANKFGILLPRGTTFVRSHRRGSADRNTKRVPIHAKGLGKLILGERNSVELKA